MIITTIITLEWVLGVAGTLIIILLGIIGYTAKIGVDIVREMSVSFHEMKDILTGQEHDLTGFRSSCDLITAETKATLGEHGQKIDSHDKMLTKHEMDIGVLKERTTHGKKN